jgi:hypothetical protein
MNIEFRKFHGPSDWGWVNLQVPIVRCEDTSGIMAVDLGTNTTVGACIMDNWTQNSVQCHFMITTPLVLKHGFLDCCADFIYNACGMATIYSLVPANNVKSVKITKHIGFTEKACLEEAYEVGIDYLLMEMKRENCIFLQKHEAA